MYRAYWIKKAGLPEKSFLEYSLKIVNEVKVPKEKHEGNHVCL